MPQVWLGTGADLGGSLRIPASFCGIVGMRPSVGLVPQSPSGSSQLKTVSGPMARNVRDLALLLDAMRGQHSRWLVLLLREMDLAHKVTDLPWSSGRETCFAHRIWSAGCPRDLLFSELPNDVQASTSLPWIVRLLIGRHCAEIQSPFPLPLPASKRRALTSDLS